MMRIIMTDMNLFLDQIPLKFQARNIEIHELHSHLHLFLKFVETWIYFAPLMQDCECLMYPARGPSSY